MALATPLAAIAKSEHLDVRTVADDPEHADEEESALSASDWLLIAADPSGWENGELGKSATTVPLTGTETIWTDDFNNLISALRLPEADQSGVTSTHR